VTWTRKEQIENLEIMLSDLRWYRRKYPETLIEIQIVKQLMNQIEMKIEVIKNEKNSRNI
jgi:hypothetical protein